MGVKKRNSFSFNWSSTANIPYSPNVPLSGVTAGVMTGTSTIYSNAQDVGNVDNLGLIVSWTGTPTGTISYLVSELGDIFDALSSFSSALAQPSGSAGSYPITFTQLPFRFFMVQYVNSSGSGLLTVSIGQKDLN